MEKIITDAIYNLEDSQFYIREFDEDNNPLGRKIMVYDNKVIMDNKRKRLNAESVIPRKVAQKNYLDIGDILFINKGEYICIYYDKTKTILFERTNDNRIDNLHQIPSRDIYLKIGTVTIEELKEIYNRFLMFKGLFKGFCVDEVDNSMKRLLEL